MEVEFTREFLEYLQGITIDGKTFTTDFPNIYPNTYTKACSCAAINCNCYSYYTTSESNLVELLTKQVKRNDELIDENKKLKDLLLKNLLK